MIAFEARDLQIFSAYSLGSQFGNAMTSADVLTCKKMLEQSMRCFAFFAHKDLLTL